MAKQEFEPRNSNSGVFAFSHYVILSLQCPIKKRKNLFLVYNINFMMVNIFCHFGQFELTDNSYLVLS